jgi:hypothetical protein
MTPLRESLDCFDYNKRMGKWSAKIDDIPDSMNEQKTGIKHFARK